MTYSILMALGSSYFGLLFLGSGSTLPAPRVLGELAADLRSLIETTRLRVVLTVNAELVMLYWEVGSRIRRDILGDARAEYGNQIVSTLSRQLTAEYGAGFSRQNLFHMIRFVEAWPEQAQMSVLAQHLGWSHFKEILYLENELARQFYAEMCRLERWSVRTLRDRVRSMMFERTAVSRLPEATIREDLQQLREADRLTPELVFRDPYLLDFLGLKDAFSECDLEAAILQELERFLPELGTDFAFLARQKRMTIGNQDFYLDLLFYHRRLARLIAIDLKLGRFEAGYKGQMELYLRWLDQNERRTEHEDAPLGLILCSAKDEEQIELLQLNQGEIRVAEYLTALPAKNILAAKLHDAVIRVREQLTRRERKPDEEWINEGRHTRALISWRQFASTDTPQSTRPPPEEWHSWSDVTPPDDFLCATLTLYWVTQTVTTSMRDYWDNRRYPVDPAYTNTPTAFGVFAHETVSEGEPPRSYLERVYNIQRWTVFRAVGTLPQLRRPRW